MKNNRKIENPTKNIRPKEHIQTEPRFLSEKKGQKIRHLKGLHQMHRSKHDQRFHKRHQHHNHSIPNPTPKSQLFLANNLIKHS